MADHFRTFQGNMAGVRRAARAELIGWWSTLDTSNPAAVAAQAREFMAFLVSAYGDVAATVAADYYDGLRADSDGATRAFRAVLAEHVPDARVNASTGWALTPIMTAPPDADDLDKFAATTLGRMLQVADGLTLGQGRATVHRSYRSDPSRPRIARIPRGEKTCAFCLMLAGRGAVYASEETAIGVTPDHYHADCDCEPLVLWRGDGYPAGYDPGVFEDAYRSARAEVEDGAPRGVSAAAAREVLAAIRQQQGVA